MENKESLKTVGSRYLTPQNTKIFHGRLGSIHCVVDETEAYANVYCLRCFPIRYPDHYISLSYTDDAGKEKEIGIIEDIAAFPMEMKTIIESSLKRQYYDQIILRILEIHDEFSLLFFEVETSDGPKKFTMRWKESTAIEYGEHGKVLLDVFENRYIIPSIEALPKLDRDRLMRFIYW